MHAFLLMGLFTFSDIWGFLAIVGITGAAAVGLGAPSVIYPRRLIYLTHSLILILCLFIRVVKV